jgi:hypothetical protein
MVLASWEGRKARIFLAEIRALRPSHEGSGAATLI